MKRLLVVAGVLVGTAALVAPVLAQTPPPEVPFPSPKADIFIAAETVTAPGSPLGAGVQTSLFARGASVVFHAYAGDTKSGRIFTDKDVKYFYVTIPDQPNLKLAFTKESTAAAKSAFLWTATWTVPATYKLGTVFFRVLVQTNAKQRGSFVQHAPATSMLTITAA